METILNIADPLVFLAGFGLLCCCGSIVFVILAVIGGAFDLLGSIIELLIGVDPFGGCGCLTLPFLCLLCGGLVYVVADILATCGTPDAVNLCRLF